MPLGLGKWMVQHCKCSRCLVWKSLLKAYFKSGHRCGGGTASRKSLIFWTLSRSPFFQMMERNEKENVRLFTGRIAASGGWHHNERNLSAAWGLAGSLWTLQGSARRHRCFSEKNWGQTWLHQGHFCRSRLISLRRRYLDSLFQAGLWWTQMEFQRYCDDRYRGQSLGASEERSTDSAGFLCPQRKFPRKCSDCGLG